MKRLLVLTTAALLALPAAASAGGWTAVNVQAPDGAAAGVVRPTTLTVLQHGRTPLDGVSPAVHIAKDGTTRSFPAAPTGRPGEYLARVVYPSAGRWDVVVDDGFMQRHRVMPVDVAAPPAVAAAASATPALIAGGAVVALILAGSALLLLRTTPRVRTTPRAGGRGPRRSRPASAS